MCIHQLHFRAILQCTHRETATLQLGRAVTMATRLTIREGCTAVAAVGLESADPYPMSTKREGAGATTGLW